MVMRSETEIFDLFFIKLTGGGIAVKIFHQELQLPTKCLNIIELDSRSGGHIGIPIVLLMILDIHCQNRSQRCEINAPWASELDAILR